jgi:hypothetical protein
MVQTYTTKETTTMTTHTKFTTDELDDALGMYFDGAEVYSDYSGRGMYGERCFGIVHNGSSAKVALAIVDALRSAAFRTLDDPDWFDMDEVMSDAEDILRRASEDSMGLSSITYFPGWVLPDDEGDE